MCYISIKTYANLTDLSERTVRRYIATMSIKFLTPYAKNRTLIPFSEVKKNAVVPLTTEDRDLILAADQGDALSQNDLALLLLEHAKAELAIYWLTLAAKQDCADAMQLLGECYMDGCGVEKDRNQAIMWISKAAIKGSILASKQMAALFCE